MREDLQGILDSLVTEELTEAKRYIEFRLSRATKGDITPRQFLIWRALCAATRSEHMAAEASLRAFIYSGNGFGIAHYSAAVSAIDTYVTAGLDGAHLNKQERIKLYILCFESILMRMAHKAIPLSTRVVLQHTSSSLEAAMEWQYPGYYRARLLHLLVKGKNEDAPSEN